MRQIRNATKLHIYKDISNLTQQISCPITLSPFQENHAILEIIHCRHIFKERALKRHFETSTRCPLCRFDIREYDPNSNNSENNNSESAGENTIENNEENNTNNN